MKTKQRSHTWLSSLAAWYFVCLAVNAHAFYFEETIPSTWAHTYGGMHSEEPHAIQQTDDGGYLAAGWTESFGNGADYLITRVDADGQLQWAKTLDGLRNDKAYSLVKTSDGGFVVAGSSNSFGGEDAAYDMWVIRFAADGTIAWQKAYSAAQDKHAHAHAIRQTGDGGFIVAGQVEKDVWVMKLDTDGTIQWQRDYGKQIDGSFSYDPVEDAAYAVQQTTDGGYIVAGYTQFFGANGVWRHHAWILKLKPNGDMEWNREFGAYGSWDEFHAVRQTSDGGYIATGVSHPYGGNSAVLLVKLDAQGKTEWKKTLGGPSYDGANDVSTTADGGYLVTGYYTLDNDARALWLLNFSADGTLNWQYVYGSAAEGYAVQQNPDGGFVVLGSTYVSSTKDDLWILKLDANGQVAQDCSVQGVPATISSVGTSEDQGNRGIYHWVNYTLQPIVTDVAAIDQSLNDNEQCYAMPATRGLAVVIDPAAGGSVSALGIDCPDDCSESYMEGTKLNLEATPADGYEFTGWLDDCGECSDQAACPVVMNSDYSCTAAFQAINANQPPEVTAFTAQPGNGNAPLDVVFDCAATDPDGEVAVYEFDFGDGSEPVFSETGQVSYSYQDAGSYQASCKAYDDGEAVSDPATVDITVTQPSWQEITGQLQVSHSPRQLYDRVHRVFFSLITVKNPGAALAGPIRMVIVDPSLPVLSDVGTGLEPDGFTDEGHAYFVIVPEGGTLGAGASLRNLRVNFQLQRKRLTYSVRIEQFR